ncbi:hypothetical protein AK830_g1260 [Neonectria ditissima]|uniref:Uncharacterized protein n=1 Tax=Neonectria ditissima TaxID=78410 RepID=A0A0P7BUL7_9HYPO|nr:hypothetical protein AK830_g1260 [Neonectria ditissima]
MSSSKSAAVQYFDLSCPDGGTYYICEHSDNEFIGCCTSHPCADGSGICPDGHLRASSFDADTYDDMQTQSCDDTRGRSVWYACQSNDPPFIGCCDESPCADGCPRSKLLPAVLSPLKKNRQAFLDPEGDPSSKTATATSTASATSSAISHDDGGLSTGAIAGIAAGAAALGVILLGLLIWRCWWHPRKQKQNGQHFHPVASQFPQDDPSRAYDPSQSPGGYYQQSFSTAPVSSPRYPPGFPMDQYDKHSPDQAAYDRPLPLNNYSRPSPAHVHSYGQAYSPMPTMPVQEMEGAYPLPQELPTGQSHGIHQSQNQSPIMHQVTP